MSILLQTPFWVWCLLTLLVALGAWQMRARQVAPRRLLVLPGVLLGLGLWSLVPAWQAQPLGGALWLAALVAGVAMGARLLQPRGARWLPGPGLIHLPGSALPLAVALAIFMLRYGIAVGQALHAPGLGLLRVQGPLALLLGGLSGLFLGRALGLLRLTRGGRASALAA